MNRHCAIVLTILVVCCKLHTAVAQDSTGQSLLQIPSQYLESISSKSEKIEEKLDAKTKKALWQFRKQQNKLKRKLYKIDSSAANSIFNTAELKFSNLEKSFQQPQKSSQYIPFLDTLKTSLKFLSGGFVQFVI
jgi:hypothetical protein